jgi:hypothetical protein
LNTISNAPCNACGGSGWVTRDPDIGTDTECPACSAWPYAGELRRERDELAAQVHIVKSERDELASGMQALRARTDGGEAI